MESLSETGSLGGLLEIDSMLSSGASNTYDLHTEHSSDLTK